MTTPRLDGSRWALIGAATVLTSWVLAVVLMSGRGFDITDEGFYVLSYRWWDTNPHTFTGAQYIYGPVFDLLGRSIRLLRLVHLITVLLVGLTFARCFVSWLESRRGKLTDSWRPAAIVALVASTGMIFSWLPLTPGYNDVAALGALASAGLVLSSSARANRQERMRLAEPVAIGAIMAMAVFARWSSAPVLLILAIGAVLGMPDATKKSLTAYAGAIAAGAVLILTLVDVFIFPITRAFAEIHTVSSIAASEGGGVAPVLGVYATTLLRTLLAASLIALPVLIVALWVRRRNTPPDARPAAWLAVSFAATIGLVVAVHGWEGGPANSWSYLASVFALALPIFVVGAGRLPRVEAGPLVMLLLLPFAQAFGTSNSIILVGANALPAWFAVGVWVTATATARSEARRVAGTATASMLALIGAVAVTGVLLHPYRTSAFSNDTTPVESLGGLSLPMQTASEFEALHRALAPYTQHGKAGVFALDMMSGYIYASGAQAAGELWTGPDSLQRSAEMLKLACRHGEYGRQAPPILLYNRPPALEDAKALAACGLDRDRDYREVEIPGGPPGVTAWVPRSVPTRPAGLD